MLVIRIIVFLVIVLGLYAIIKMVVKPSDSIKCGRCHGKGYWLGARGRETCDWCKGSGRLPHHHS